MIYLKDKTDQDLAQLEKNAKERSTGQKAEEAKLVLKAVEDERSRRTMLVALTKAQEAEDIKETVRGWTFEQRVIAAFDRIPPSDWERDALKALASHPGATTEELSQQLGYSGTYMNWFGHVCRDRESWLGPATKNSDGETIYSTLLVEFEPSLDPTSGRKATKWRLKPEAQQGLQKLGVI